MRKLLRRDKKAAADFDELIYARVRFAADWLCSLDGNSKRKGRWRGFLFLSFFFYWPVSLYAHKYRWLMGSRDSRSFRFIGDSVAYRLSTWTVPRWARLRRSYTEYRAFYVQLLWMGKATNKAWRWGVSDGNGSRVSERLLSARLKGPSRSDSPDRASRPRGR